MMEGESELSGEREETNEWWQIKHRPPGTGREQKEAQMSWHLISTMKAFSVL